MLVDSKSLRSLIASQNRPALISIRAGKSLSSVCAVSIFTRILKKQLIRFELEFVDLEDFDFLFTVDSSQFEVGNGGLCSCCAGEIAGSAILFQVAKSMDFAVVETVWPLAVCYSFYREFLFRTLQDSEDMLCSFCKSVGEDLVVQIKTLNCRQDGLFYMTYTPLTFLDATDLFTALVHDLPFLYEHKLLGKKRIESKIYEMLARKGISIKTAHEPFKNVCGANRDVIDAVFGESNTFVFKSGHNIEITAVEQAFLIQLYLYRKQEASALLCLEKKELIDSEKASKFYLKCLRLFCEAVDSVRKAENILIYKVSLTLQGENEDRIILKILYILAKVFAIHRGYPGYKQLLAVDKPEDHETILYSEDSLPVSHGHKRVAGGVAIKTAELPGFLRKLQIKK